MKNLILSWLGLAAIASASAETAPVWEMESPDGNIKVAIGQNNATPVFNVSYQGKEVCAGDLGLFTSDADFSRNLQLKSPGTTESFTETYDLVHGKKKSVSNSGNRRTASFSNADGDEIELEVKVFNDGLAFRYVMPNPDNKKITFTGEATSFTFPADAPRWMQKYVTSYEGDFPRQNGATASGEWGYPALFEASEGVFTLLTEAGTSRMYCATHLSNSAESRTYTIAYPGAGEGNGIGAVNPVWTGKWESPWRVLIIGNLNDIVESTLVEDVSQPCVVEDTSWIEPGRAAWVYWAYNHGTKDFKICQSYVDLAAAMGWEYVLFDWEWDEMGNGGRLEDAVKYALSKGIQPLMWYNSGGPHNGVGSTPRDRMLTHESRVKEFTWLRSLGVAGVKIDFFESDKQDMMNYYLDILEDARNFNMLVNFHGCTVPRGWHRTYPNLISYEAVYGAEQYNNSSFMTSNGPRINCLLPFTRNVVGPMDYTPVAFTNSQNAHLTSYAHELALSVAFQSGIQHWADRPEGFLGLPESARRHMQRVPATWDETIFVDGYPGESFVVARRKGDVWYLSGIVGENRERDMELTLDFLDDGKTYNATVIADGPTSESFRFSHMDCRKGETLTLHCLGYGGFTVVFGENADRSLEELRELISRATQALASVGDNIGETTGTYDRIVVDALTDALADAGKVKETDGAAIISQAYDNLMDALCNFQSFAFLAPGCVPDKHRTMNVTRKYLVEARNFSRSDTGTGTSTRFGLLGEPWQYTPNIVNMDNFTHGGFDSFEGGKYISIEKYDDGLPAIRNGLLFQTSKKALPKGEYSVKLYVTSNYGFEKGECMFNIVAGNDFNPALTPLSVYDCSDRSGWVWNWVDAGTFTVADDSRITIGWLVNIAAANSGRSVRFSDLRLYDSSGKDVTVTFFDNYREYTRKDISPLRFGKPTNWEVADFYIPNGDDGVKQGIDRYPGYNCLILGVWDDSHNASGNLAGSAIYRKVSLPAGRYFFGSSYYNIWDVRKAYLFVADLPLAASEVEDHAIAWHSVPEAAANDLWQGVTFNLDTDSDVYLGWCADLTTRGQQEFRVKEVALLRYMEKEGEWIEAEAPLLDGEHTFTAMECAEQNGAANVFSSDGRGLLRANAGSDIVVGHINTTGVKDITVNANSPFEINESTSISLITDNKDVWATVPFRESNTSSYQSYHFDRLPELNGVHQLAVRFNNISANLWDVVIKAENSGAGTISTEEDSFDSIPIYYNLQGMRVVHPTPGLYIVREGDKTYKRLVR